MAKPFRFGRSSPLRTVSRQPQRLLKLDEVSLTASPKKQKISTTATSEDNTKVLEHVMGLEAKAKQLEEAGKKPEPEIISLLDDDDISESPSQNRGRAGLIRQSAAISKSRPKIHTPEELERLPRNPPSRTFGSQFCSFS
jgi:hypothetical protein